MFQGGGFPLLAASLGAQVVCCNEVGVLVEPAGEDGSGRNPAGLSGQIDEYGLADVLRQSALAAATSQCGGIDQIQVGADQAGKGGLRTVLSELPEKFSAGIIPLHLI